MNDVGSAVLELNHWLFGEGRDASDISEMFCGYCNFIRSTLGIPVDRVFSGNLFLHPQVSGSSQIWLSTRPDKVEMKPLNHEVFRNRFRDFPEEPIVQLELGKAFVRFRRGDKVPSTSGWFDEGGYTDYLCLPWKARGKHQGGIGWATKAPKGFEDRHIEFLKFAHPSFATVNCLFVKDIVTKALLCAYLGDDPGHRVSNGLITRGDSVSINAAIWFSDLRGFTQLSMTMDTCKVLEVINAVFELTDRIVRKHGGGLLKLMGDGAMGVFTAEDETYSNDTSEYPLDTAKQVGPLLCRRAKAAAIEFQEELAKLRESRAPEGLPAPHVGIGLHYGRVSYGNVGAPERLDFTVMGKAVNLCARIESLCSRLSASLLASQDFVDLDKEGRGWKNMGEYELKGIQAPVRVLAYAS